MKTHLLLKLLFFSLINLIAIKTYTQNYTQANNWTIEFPSSTTMAEDAVTINEGSKSAKVTWTSTNAQNINSDQISVTANASYSFSVDINENTLGGQIRLAMYFDDATTLFSGYSADDPNWQTITMTGTVPAGATSLYVVIRFDDNGVFFVSPETAYVDNAIYTEDAGPNLITNGGFETWEIIDPDPPVWTGGYPQTSNITISSLDLTVSADEEGTAYYVLLADGATAPTSAEVKSGTGSGGAGVIASGNNSITSASTDFTWNITSLTNTTAYDIYIVAEDDELTPNIQASPTLVEITTAAPTAEPTNHVTAFTATAYSYNSMNLTWTDAATGAQAPVAYLIKASTGAITAPADGTDPAEDTDLSDGNAIVKVFHNGTQKYTFTGLTAATTYNFKIWSYSNDDALIDFKLDGTIPAANVATASSELFFSEYIEGGTRNTALEIYNPTGGPVNLSNYKLFGNSDGGGWIANSSAVLPNIVLAAGEVYVISRADADQAVLDEADLTYTDGPTYEMSFSGNDARALALTVDGGTTWNIIDIIGDEDVNPGAGWDVAGITDATADYSLIRKTGRTFGNDDWTSSAGTTTGNSEWIVMERDYFNNLGAYRVINTDATLSDLTVDAVTISGFTSGTFTYDKELAFGSPVPTVAATATDATYATVDVVQAQNITGTLAERTATVSVVADDLSTQDYTVVFTDAANTANDIESFIFAAFIPDVTGIIDAGAHTVTLTVPYGTNVTALVPTITVSANATISPLTAVAQNFTNPVNYTVTAEDATNQIWTVTVNAEPNTENDILSFIFETLNPDVTGVVDAGLHTVTLTVPFSTDVTALVPTITVSADATISPLSSVAQNFTSPVNYTVTAEDATDQIWVVTVNIASANTDATLGTLTVNNGTLVPVFDAETIDYTVELPYGTTIEPIVSATENDANANAVITQATDVEGDLDARTATIVVTAENGSTTKTYTIVFSVALNNDATLSALSINSGTLVPVFDTETIDYTVELPYGTTTEPVVSATENDANANAVITQATDVEGDLDARTATIVVTAENGSTTKTYTIVFSVALNNNATVTSTVYTVNSTALTITDIPAGTTLASFESNLTPATGANFETYQADGTTLATDLATDYKLIVTAEDGTTTKTYTITILTGTNSIINNVDIKLYPNPSNGLFKIELNNSNNEEFFVNIYDVIGKIVYTAKINKNTSIIDLSKINKGIYYVSIQKENNRKVTKIIIH